MSERDKKRPPCAYGEWRTEGTGPQMSRRGLLKALVLSGVALPILGCKGPSPASGCPGGASCDPYLALPPNPPPGDTVVAMVSRPDVAQMTREAIETAGGLSEIAAGDTVLIKPNIVAPAESGSLPVVTSREVLGAVIDAVKERTSGSCIHVGDASADLPAPTRTEDVAQGWGILDLCAQKGVSFVSLKDHGFHLRSHPAWEALRGWQLPISKFVCDSVQHVINVPVLKNHQGIAWSNCNYSCCIKNMFGVTDSAWRADGAYAIGVNAFHDERLADNLAELHLVLPPILMNVVDAVRVIVQGGPAGAAQRLQISSPGLVLAGKDGVATDAAALAVLRCHGKRQGVTFSSAAMDYARGSVWENPQIVRAAHHGLGRINLDRDGLHLRQVSIQDNGSVADLGAILAEWA